MNYQHALEQQPSPTPKRRAPVRHRSGESFYLVDSADSGLEFARFHPKEEENAALALSLTLPDLPYPFRPKRRHQLGEEALAVLERRLQEVSEHGDLRRSHFYMGVHSDPFFPFDQTFDGTRQFLKLFARYLPGHLVIQTRSPLIVIALRELQALGNNLTVSMVIESSSEESLKRYLPKLPPLHERISAIRALRRFGIKTQVAATPLLPYGEWRKDAHIFAALLNSLSDHIIIKPLQHGRVGHHALARSQVIRDLVRDRKYEWLRPDADQPLLEALAKIAPKKIGPQALSLGDQQIGLFGTD